MDGKETKKCVGGCEINFSLSTLLYFDAKKLTKRSFTPLQHLKENFEILSMCPLSTHNSTTETDHYQN